MSALQDASAAGEGAVESVENPEVILAEHGQRARKSYETLRGNYVDFANVMHSILQHAISGRGVYVHSVTGRAKDLDSFAAKASRPHVEDPRRPKYTNPLKDITDLAGVRVTTYFLDDVRFIEELVASEFEVVERSERRGSNPTVVGYQSLHFLLKLRDSRASLTEYSRFTGLVCELQVRTILQHAWAEIEHDINYKAVGVVPDAIRRRFNALAGVIEIADREFQAIKVAHDEVQARARERVGLGDLASVEITADSLKAYLDREYGSDGRVSQWSYQFTARILVNAGFKNLAEVEECIEGYDADLVSRTLWGTRQGQLSRFDDVLIASMGLAWAKVHPWSLREDWYETSCARRLQALRNIGVVPSNFKPSGYKAAQRRFEMEREGEDS
ncbi:GTP pyrophosphokinase [Quadrisphaera setariae]|uniref:RelA/SpoT domain-containing protein n=1 Tax=Quadrisphaera setariae TaxID=2593304 RepID=A0A5C8Z227_9ACTN|nr:hypothetical protein [Quadrisphaera setariae]TXR51597.1 hypothetical protein FMM08_22000 [Quadrisphaera setariae]